MTLIAKPKGRGNWRPLVLTIETKHVPPLFVVVGHVFFLGGVSWRICEVRV